MNISLQIKSSDTHRQDVIRVDEYSSSIVRLIAEEHQLGQTPVIHTGEHASASTSQQDTDATEATHETIAS